MKHDFTLKECLRLDEKRNKIKECYKSIAIISNDEITFFGNILTFDGKEYYKLVPDTTDIYVSNQGKVIQVQNVMFEENIYYKIMTLTQCKCTSAGNYLCVLYYTISGKRKNTYVHRLVAEAFCPKIPEENIIHHIDGNKYNNNANNLMWTTSQLHKKIHRAMRLRTND